MSVPVPKRSAGDLRVFVRAGLCGLLLALGLFGACDDSQCHGNVEVTCDEEGCVCAAGDAEGEPCSEDVEPDDPMSCEVVCCDSPL